MMVRGQSQTGMGHEPSGISIISNIEFIKSGFPDFSDEETVSSLSAQTASTDESTCNKSDEGLREQNNVTSIMDISYIGNDIHLHEENVARKRKRFEAPPVDMRSDHISYNEESSFQRENTGNDKFTSKKRKSSQEGITQFLTNNVVCSKGPARELVSTEATYISSDSAQQELNQVDQLQNATPLLHSSCKLFSKSIVVVSSALQLDPDAVRNRATVLTPEILENCRVLNQRSDGQKKINLHREPYTLPLNIAISNEGSADVVNLLIKADPNVLIREDGPDRCGSLSVAISQRPINYEVTNLLISADSSCVNFPDRRQNYPLHLACFFGATLDLISRLYALCPPALFQKNLNNETPLDIAKRYQRCSQQVLLFLQKENEKALSLMN